jgi:hypothetical protein
MDGPGRRSFALSLNRSATRGGRLTTNILLSNNSPGEVQWKLSNPSEDDDPPFLPLLHGGRRTAFSQSQLHADLSKKKTACESLRLTCAPKLKLCLFDGDDKETYSAS